MALRICYPERVNLGKHYAVKEMMRATARAASVISPTWRSPRAPTAVRTTAIGAQPRELATRAWT